MLRTLWSDLEAVLDNDPAAGGYLEAALCHTPLHAIWWHRVSHFLYQRLHLRVLPRFASVLARSWSGVEIHPAASIGAAFFVDHGAGVVIGETVEIGQQCVLFHNVTLGGTGKHTGKRHPTIGDNVLIGTGATLLGPIKVGNNSKIGANTFIIMHDVPPDCTVIGTPGRVVRLNGLRVDLALGPTVIADDSIRIEVSDKASTLQSQGTLGLRTTTEGVVYCRGGRARGVYRLPGANHWRVYRSPGELVLPRVFPRIIR